MYDPKAFRDYFWRELRFDMLSAIGIAAGAALIGYIVKSLEASAQHKSWQSKVLSSREGDLREKQMASHDH